MDCAICGKDSKYRRVKGMFCCVECTRLAKQTREHLNATRTNPKSRFNMNGEEPVTLREIVTRAIVEQSLKSQEELKDETLRTS